MIKTKQTRGFTLIELLIVIIIIGILAAITIVSYNGVQDRAHYAKEQEEMRQINQAIQMYYADNGSYPLCDTSNTTSYHSNYQWCGYAQSTNFILGLVPKYISKIPNMNYGSDTISDSYVYKSDGNDYKLIRNSGSEGLPSIERTNNSLADQNPHQIVTNAYGAWGYWSDGAKDW